MLWSSQGLTVQQIADPITGHCSRSKSQKPEATAEVAEASKVLASLFFSAMEDGQQPEPLNSNNPEFETSRNLLDIEKEKKEKYDPKYAPLYKALRTGNLEATNEFLDKNPEAATARISPEGKTPLHVAALFGHLHIVTMLLQQLTPEAVELLDFNHLTALHETSFTTSCLDIADCLVTKNSNLLEIPSAGGSLPVTRALGVGQIEMARYLYWKTPNEVFKPENGTQGAKLLKLCYYSQLLDMALHLLDKIPSLAVTADDRGETFLEALGSIPSAFPSGCKLSFWQRWIYHRIDISREELRKVQHNWIPLESANGNISVNIPNTCTSQCDGMIMTRNKSHEKMLLFCGRKSTIYKTKLAHKQALELLRMACETLSTLDEEQLKTSRAREAVVQANKRGVIEFFTEALKVHFHLASLPMFHAVKFRQARVFSLNYGIFWKNVVANQTDKEGNTLLHMAGLLEPSTLNDISGAALQMQRELQWFKEVESITPSLKKETQNKAKLTARQLFTENHKELVKQGEKWMKGTATSCSLVAALVATVVFAAAFTVPGGNDQDRGYPIFSKKKGFMVFILSDAVSLFSSTTSIIMFLGILTSRYSEDDFLKALPTKLIIGLLTLFISMGTMLVAFSAALFVMLHGKLWIVIPVSVLAAVPVISFGCLQFPLLVEMIMSTYGPSIFDRNPKPWLTDDSM